MHRKHGRTYVFAPTSEQLFDQLISPDNAVALRTAAEKGKLMIALPSVRQLPWLIAEPDSRGRQCNYRSATRL